MCRQPPQPLLPPRRPQRKSNLCARPPPGSRCACAPLLLLRCCPGHAPCTRGTRCTAAPATPAAPAAPPGPEVTTIEPPRVGLGFDMDLKITGKNFVQGAKVSFANPGIRVMGITSPSSTELTVHIKVARDAAPGVASLYVINPDDREVEAPFEVTGKGAATALRQPLRPAFTGIASHPGFRPTRNVMMLSIWEILRRSFRFTAR